MTAEDFAAHRLLRQEAFYMENTPGWSAFDSIYTCLIDNPPKLKETTND